MSIGDTERVRERDGGGETLRDFVEVFEAQPEV